MLEKSFVNSEFENQMDFAEECSAVADYRIRLKRTDEGMSRYLRRAVRTNDSLTNSS